MARRKVLLILVAPFQIPTQKLLQRIPILLLRTPITIEILSQILFHPDKNTKALFKLMKVSRYQIMYFTKLVYLFQVSKCLNKDFHSKHHINIIFLSKIYSLNDNISIQYRQVEYIIYWSKFQTIIYIYIFEIFLKCHIISLWLLPFIFYLSSDATYGGLCYFKYLRFCNITIGCHMRY